MLHPHPGARSLLLVSVAVTLFFVLVGAALGQVDGEAPLEATALSLSVVPRVSTGDGPMRIDGRLDEPAWQRALELPLPWEFQPGDRVPALVDTLCLVTYDADALYVAFRAHEPEPESIRARLADRDRAFEDDWVGVYLDTFDDQRRAFELIVSPLGVQMDLIRSEVGSGNQEDASWDAIWESAGRLTGEGFVVEMAVPFTSLRFQNGGGAQTWGLIAFRNRPRSVQRKFASVPLDPNVDCVLCQEARVRGFEDAEPGRNLELDPTLTAGFSEIREDLPDGELTDDGGDLEPGLTALWGVTPNLTLAATLNPDFSQVEADVAQLDVNTRFTLFFPEKRPFFLEGADFFSTPLNTVFTRNVSDPDWGLKLTGKSGANALGVFVAEDSVTNLVLPGSEGSSTASLPIATTGAAVRYRRDIGAASTVGVLATAREGTDYSNQVYGVDGHVRLSDVDSLTFQALGSATEYPEALAREEGQPLGRFQDRAFAASYRHDSRAWGWSAGWEDLGRDFRTDLGFEPQVDARKARTRVRRSWWGDDDDWWTRLEVDADYDYTEDHSGTLLEGELELGVEMSGPWQSFARFEWGGRDQSFAGVEFDDLEEWVGIVSVRPNEAFRVFTFVKVGDAVDFTNVRPADRVLVESEMELNFGRHAKVEVRNNFERLDVDAGRLFTANLTQLTGVYQVNVRTFVRLISQYTRVDREPEQYVDEVAELDERLFNQLLLSYKINPQTVAFLGYSDSYGGAADYSLTQEGRTIFMKIGYALVF